MELKRNLVGLAIGGTALVAALGPAMAFASDNQLTPGIPGTAECHGQTVAFLAQMAQNFDITALPPGLGNFAKDMDVETQVVQDMVWAYCGELGG
jgi:hypothetical protein